ncbi:nucleotidyltransferase [Natronolimnobius sp. AArcel1]|nr:nucleotidyltransferase [Natronolimnobius sp. AArcel1]
MAIPESQFEGWYKTGADAGSATARGRIKRILEMDRSPIQQNEDCSFKVFLQGSYKNHTHTRGSSDVDIVVKLTSAWRRDLSNLTSTERDRYHNNSGSADYSYTEFSDDVWNWLRRQFNNPGDRISRGNKAIAIESDRLPVDVDVVPCADYRIYNSYPPTESNTEPDIDHGMYFDAQRTGERIINYPQIHYTNGCQKHSKYKETVRIFKNARDYYNDHFSTWQTIDAHSYGIECLIYNVPDEILQRSRRRDRFIEVLDHLQDESTDLSGFDQVSEEELLFGDSNTQWDLTNAEQLLSRLREMWNEWYDKQNAQLLH